MQSAGRLVVLLAALVAIWGPASGERAGGAELERALEAARAAPDQEESYQRVYEAFTRLVENVSSNSLGGARRLVARLNSLVGGQSQAQEAGAAKRPAESADERTEQILTRIDGVNKDTDQHTLVKLNEDVNKLVATLNDSYLRNIRRVIERVNKMVGGPGGQPLHQSADRLEEGQRQPGFPGWDELLTAVDRMQKSLASFVRSSTKLITAGR